MKWRRRNLCAAGAVLLTLPLAAAPASALEIREGEFWLEDYGVTEAWETTHGDGVTIAVIDTGIDGDHPTLSGAVTGGTDVSGGGDGSGGPVDQAHPEHGTLVASLAAGRGEELPEPEEIDDDEIDAEEFEAEDLEDLSDEEWDEWFDGYVEDLEDFYGEDYEDIIDPDTLDEFYETREFPEAENAEELEEEDIPDVPWPERPMGVVGVAPEADLLSISLVLEDPNPYGPGTDEQIAEAVIWAVDNGADIINMSIGSGVQDWSEEWDEAFLHAEENDVLVVAAAGNRAAGHLSVGAPATIPGVLAVAGVDEDRNISEESSSQGIAVDIAAASEPLVGALPGGENGTWTGTSGATPIVAGAAALVMAAHPELSAPEVKHRLLSTADSAGSEGIDPEFGHGVLNVADAVSGSVPDFNADDHETLADWILVHRRAETEEEQLPEIPEDSGVVAGPEGEPRGMPQAAAPNSAQDWAGPVTLGLAGLTVVVLLTFAAVHLLSRRENS